MIEQWRVHPYWFNYEISDHGRVRRLTAQSGTKVGRIRKPVLIKKYLALTLKRNGEQRTRHIHLLVLEAFIGFCPKGKQARHLDGDNLNNKLSNLRWGTPKENGEDRVRHGTVSR